MVTKTLRPYVPDRGDIIHIDLEPTRGHEQGKWRPALVLSPKAYNTKTSLLLACPITSRAKGYPFEVAIESSAMHGVALADQVRALDWRTRGVRFMERANPESIAEAQAKIVALVEG